MANKSNYFPRRSSHFKNYKVILSGRDSLIKKLNLAELIYGHRKIDNFDVVVSSGASGWGYPLRTAGQSEYVVINILGKEG